MLTHFLAMLALMFSFNAPVQPNVDPSTNPPAVAAGPAQPIPRYVTEGDRGRIGRIRRHVTAVPPQIVRIPEPPPFPPVVASR